MLLRFSISNYRSLRDQQELSMLASALEGPSEGLIEAGLPHSQKVLPAVVVYGANASGKTNLVRAIRWMRSAVLYSHSRGEPDSGVPRSHFAFDPSFSQAPTRANVDFVVDGVRHHYGFEADNREFTAEWLFSFPNDRRQSLFEREGMQFRFGRNLRGRNQVISELTRPNSLFLSAATQNGHDDLTKIVRFFQSIEAVEVREYELAKQFSDPSLDPRVIQFLNAAGTGVVDYRLKEIEAQPQMSKFLDRLDKLFKDNFEQGLKSVVENTGFTSRLQLGHQGVDGKSVYFELNEESDGTRRLLRLLIPAFRALATGAVMIVDELDSSLHTQACEKVTELFSLRQTNPKGAQLIATTHDTNVLQSPYLRRDQVWFAEKDNHGATDLYPLTDFRTRKSDNLERGYLQGRYGAVPFSGVSTEFKSGPAS